MTGRTSTLAFLALLILLTGQASPRSADISEREKHLVYNAVIAHMFAGDKVTFDTQSKVKQIVILDRTTTDYAYGGKKENWEEVKVRLSTLSDETITDYEAKLKTSTELKRSFDLRLSYSLFSQKDYDTIFDAKGNFDREADNWAKFYERFPDSGGHIALSNVGFNKAREQALVYFVHWCGSLCGTGHYVLLTKSEKGWQVAAVAMIWIS